MYPALTSPSGGDFSGELAEDKMGTVREEMVSSVRQGCNLDCLPGEARSSRRFQD